ncbi:MAG: hypothetical protein RRC07_18255, partial [Anaerolineae bacterium]|nr:hypothetical protein [Anaerolineae bacterium]
MAFLPFRTGPPADPLREAAAALQGELRGLFEVHDVRLRGRGPAAIVFSGRYLGLEPDGSY